MRLIALFLLCLVARGATIEGVVAQPDGTPYTGQVTFYPLTAPMVVDGAVVGGFTNRVTPTSLGAFTNSLAAGEYDVGLGVTKRFRITVPDSTNTYSLSDLITTNAYWGTNINGAIRVNGSGVVTIPSNFWLANSNAIASVAGAPTLGSYTNLTAAVPWTLPDEYGAAGSIWTEDGSGGFSILGTSGWMRTRLSDSYTTEGDYIRREASKTNSLTFEPTPAAPSPVLGEAPIYAATNSAGNARLKTKNRAGTHSTVATDADVPAYVADLTALAALSGDATTAVVADTNRGGVFSYTTTTMTPNGGTVLAATGKSSGYWVRNSSAIADIRWYGGLPNDGVNDDAALTAAIAAGHQAIRFPAADGKYSVYNLTNRLLSANVWLVGDGGNSILCGQGYGATNYHLLRLTNTWNVKLSNLGFSNWYAVVYGYVNNGAVSGIGSIDSIEISDCIFTNCSQTIYTAISGSGTSQDLNASIGTLRYERNKFYGCLDDSISAQFGMYHRGIRTTNCYILDSLFVGGQYGIRLGANTVVNGGGVSDFVQNASIERCKFIRQFGTSPEEIDGIEPCGRAFRVMNNYFENQPNGWDGVHAISIKCDSLEYGYNTHKNAGIETVKVKAPLSALVHDNVFVYDQGFSNRCAILFDGGGGCRVSRNQFYGAMNSESNYGLVQGAYTTGGYANSWEFKDNSFYSCTNNIGLFYFSAADGMTNNVTNVVASGNIFVGCTALSAFNLGSSGTRIEQITIRDNAVHNYPSASAGIVTFARSAGAAKIGTLKIENNSITSVSTLYDVGTAVIDNCIVRDNVCRSVGEVFSFSTGTCYSTDVRNNWGLAGLSNYGMSVSTRTNDPNGLQPGQLGSICYTTTGAWGRYPNPGWYPTNDVECLGIYDRGFTAGSSKWIVAVTNGLMTYSANQLVWSNINVTANASSTVYLVLTNLVSPWVTNAWYQLRYDAGSVFGTPVFKITTGAVYTVMLPYQRGVVGTDNEVWFRSSATETNLALSIEGPGGSQLIVDNISLKRIDWGWQRFLSEETNGTITRLNGISFQAGSGAPLSTGTVSSVYQNLTGDAATALAVKTDNSTTGWRWVDLQSHADPTAIASTNTAISPSARLIRLASGSSYTLSSTPTISAGNAGQILILTMYNSSGTVTLQDEQAYTGTGLQLGAPTRKLTGDYTLTLIYDGSFWKELAYTTDVQWIDSMSSVMAWNTGGTALTLDTNYAGLKIDKGDLAFGTIQLNHDVVTNGTITVYPHIHFLKTVDETWGSPSNVVWELSYRTAPIGSVFPAWTYVKQTNNVNPHYVTTAGAHNIVDVPTAGFTITNCGISQIIAFRLSRVNEAADDYVAGNVIIEQVDVHYPVNSRGSTGATSK